MLSATQAEVCGREKRYAGATREFERKVGRRQPATHPVPPSPARRSPGQTLRKNAAAPLPKIPALLQLPAPAEPTAVPTARPTCTRSAGHRLRGGTARPAEGRGGAGRTALRAAPDRPPSRPAPPRVSQTAPDRPELLSAPPRTARSASGSAPRVPLERGSGLRVMNLRPSRAIRGLERLPCEQKQRELGLFVLKSSRISYSNF